VASRTAVLAVRIVSDAKDSARGFSDAEKATGGFTRNLDRASVAAGGVLAGVGALAKSAFDAASNAQQAAGAVESVFGAQAAAVKKNAAAAAEQVGLASSEYSNLAAVLGSQLKNMGTSADQLAPKTDSLIQMGADLAATYGGTTSDAVQALSSVLKGETDPIERYGISIKQSDINARMAAQGHADLEGAAAKAAQAQAVMSLLTDQSTSALGAFGREADTAAGQQQRASAEWENAKAALGESLLPLVTQGAQLLGGLAQSLQDNQGAATALIGTIAALAAGVLIVNGAVKAYKAAQVVVTAAQWAWNVATSANPLGLLLLAVTGVIAVVVVLYNKFDAVKRIVDKVGGALKSAGRWVGGLFGAAGPAVSPGSAYGAAGALYGATGGGPSTLRAAGALTAAGAGSVGTTGLTGQGATVRGGDTINITVNGAVDRYGTASTIRDLLDERARNLGQTTALSVGMGRS